MLWGERKPYQNAAAIITENMPHSRRSGVELKSETLAMLDLMVSAFSKTWNFKGCSHSMLKARPCAERRNAYRKSPSGGRCRLLAREGSEGHRNHEERAFTCDTSPQQGSPQEFTHSSHHDGLEHLRMSDDPISDGQVPDTITPD